MDFGKDELSLIQPGVRTKNGYKVWHENYMCDKYHLFVEYDRYMVCT